jgi:hypothetical protein
MLKHKKDRTEGRSPSEAETFRALKQWAVAKANENNSIMDGTIEPVKEIKSASDLVLAVWQDLSEPDGVGMLVVKGQALLRQVSAEQVSKDVTC